MEKLPEIKYVVKKILVTKSFQKIRFQVRHPESVYTLVGIAAVTSAIKGPQVFGILTLAIPEKGDVFYTEEVTRNDVSFFDLPGATQIFQNNTNIIFSSRKKTFFETSIPVTEAIIEGYYESFFDSGRISSVYVAQPAPVLPAKSARLVSGKVAAGSPSPGEIAAPVSNELYKVTLYLKYKRNKPLENDSPVRD